MGELVLVRHGETEWSADGRHTSRTDLDLTRRGENQARALASALSRRRFVAVLSSPRRRALRTAELAGLSESGESESGDVAGRGNSESGDVAGRGNSESGDVAGRGKSESGDVAGRGKSVTAVDDDLAEWDYGEYEGITTAEIRAHRPDWSLWTDGAPGGESPEQIGARVDRVLAQVRPMLVDGDIALVGHGHALRVLGARWVGLPPGGGGLLKLDTATLSVLSLEHGRPVIDNWNAPVTGPP